MRPETILKLLVLMFSLSSFASEEIIRKKFYTLSYNEEHEVANWAAYELNRDRLKSCAKRNDDFRPDPQVSTGSADASDYKRSGYDRGHLVPAGDMKFNKTAMSETFFFSNMTPQPSSFNQGKWSDLENLIRSWGALYNGISIVTGPILKENLRVIGVDNKVSVPEQYFKVVIRKKGTTYEGIAFLMSTKTPYSDLSAYVTTIDEVEELSGFDFFQELDDTIEDKIESESEKKNWDFKGKFDYYPCRPSGAQSQM